MKIIFFLERNNIATKETVEIFKAVICAGFVSWLLYKYNFPWWAFCFLVMAMGGEANLYVISFNNFRMPVLARDRREFNRFKKLNPSRRICAVNKKTKLAGLCDRFWFGKSICSIGDFMLYFGAILIVAPFIEMAIRLIK